MISATFHDGAPTYVYDPTAPFGAVPYLFRMKDGREVEGIGIFNYQFFPKGYTANNYPIHFYDLDGDPINGREIVAYAFTDPKYAKSTNVEALPYGYYNRHNLTERIREISAELSARYPNENTSPVEIADGYIQAHMQTIITALHCLTTHPSFEKLMDYQDVVNVVEHENPDKPQGRSVYRRIVEPFNNLLWKLVDDLCDIRDKYKDEFGHVRQGHTTAVPKSSKS